MSVKNLAGNALLKHPDMLFIGGKWVKPSTDRKLTVIAPANETPYLQVAEAMEADVEAAVAAARDAFDNGPWPWMTPQERAGYLRLMADEVAKRADKFAEIWPNEMGILHSAAKGVSAVTPSVIGRYADMADSFAFTERRESLHRGKIGMVVREPVGVVAAIIPWNAPLNLITHKIAPALLAGCCVILKASPEAPGEAYLMAEIIEEIGLPAGVVNIITADRDVSEHLVRHHGVDKVSFTGSSAAGKRIASILGGVLPVTRWSWAVNRRRLYWMILTLTMPQPALPDRLV